MTPDFSDTRTLLDQLKTAGREYFGNIINWDVDDEFWTHLEADHYWSAIRQNTSRDFLKASI